MQKQTKSNRQAQFLFVAIAIVVLLFVGSLDATAQTTYKVGDKIEVQYGYNAWYKAEILEVKDGSYKVRYSDGSADEWVIPNRMRTIGGKVPTGNQPPNVPDENPRATYNVGDRVEVQYDNSWYRAGVVAVKDGLYRIRYEGDNTASEQWVEPNRMRRTADKTPPVKPSDVNNLPPNQTTKDNQPINQPGETAKGNKYDTRDPRTCADKKAPARGAITQALALKYLICEREKVSGGYLYLVEDVKLQVGGGIPYNPNANLNVPDIDVRFPLYSIRGSLVGYQCNPLRAGFDWSAPGKNCNKTIEPKASGSCYRTTFREWRCHMADLSNNSENWFPRVAPPKP